MIQRSYCFDKWDVILCKGHLIICYNSCNGSSVSCRMKDCFYHCRVTQSRCITIHPWLLHFCNSMSYQDQLSPVLIPDVIPANLPTYGLFSMAAGDFLEVYTEKGSVLYHPSQCIVIS